jgi:hypothetical protein
VSLGEVDVTFEHMGLPSIHVHGFEVDGLEQRPRVGDRQFAPEPLREVDRPDRTVRANVATAGFAERVLLVHGLPPVDPAVRPDEGDPVALRRSLAELVEEEREAGEQPRVTDRRSQLLARQDLVSQCGKDGLPNGLRFVETDRGMEDAVRVAPFGNFLRSAGNRAASGEPELQLVRGMQVKRSAQRPGFDERTVAPKRVAYSLLGDALDTGRQLQLGGGLNLRVDPADVVDDVDKPLSLGAFGEEAACEPASANLVPGDRDQLRNCSRSTSVPPRSHASAGRSTI